MGVVLCRAFCCLVQGLGWLPIITVIRIVLRFNLDAAIDIFLMSSMEQVGFVVECCALYSLLHASLLPPTQ